MIDISKIVGKIRPQVFIAIILLCALAIISVYLGVNEIAGVAAAGIIALAKDVIQTDT